MNTKNKLKIGLSTLAIAAFMTMGSDLYASCPSKCVSVQGETKTGYCGPGQNGKECSDTGTGTPDCTGHYTPVKCAEQ